MSVEFLTNEELIEELFKRSTFKGLLFYNGGEHDNKTDGNGKVRLKASKGLAVLDLMLFLRFGIDTFCKMFPDGFKKIFPDFITEVPDKPSEEAPPTT